MKMNRTEWAVVILCALCLAWVITAAPRPAPLPAKAAAAASAPGATPGTSGEKPLEPAPPTPPTPAAAEETTVLKNGSAEYTFTNLGGGLKQVKILAGPYAGKTEQLLNDRNPGGAVAPIGALSRAVGDLETLTYAVTAKSDTAITFTATGPDGLQVTKAWSMAAGDPMEAWGYVWDLKVSFRNTGASKVAGEYYLYAGALGPLHSNDWLKPASSWYADGSAVEQDAHAFDAGRFLGIFWQTRPAVTEIKSALKNMTWGGVHNQYYAVLVSPSEVKTDGTVTPLWSKPFEVSFKDPGYPAVHGKAIQAAVGIPALQLDPNTETAWSGQIYTGPRSGTVLNKIGGERNQAMHYGMFRSLSRLFLGLLNKFHTWVDSYGIAIMMLTFLVRFCIWPLHIKSTKAMKRMSKLSPMMQELKDKYKDDPAKMQTETMKLYRDYGVNPVGGCLPLLLQFPIFLGYYGMMRTAVEMRGHSFLWVKDLSMPDTVAHIAGFPLNPLPIIMAVTMYVQMAVTPKPAEINPQMEMQQKIFKIMPFFFLLFCYGFASALALYWSVQNVISIGQTYLMKLQPEPELKKLPPRQSFMERALAAQQAAQQAKKGPKPPRTGGGKSAFRKNQD